MAGFSITLAKAEAIYQLDFCVSWGVIITLLLFVSLLSVYLFKLIKQYKAVIPELYDPIKISFFPTISISLILLAIALLHKNSVLAEPLWLIVSCLHLIFILYVMNAGSIIIILILNT